MGSQPYLNDGVPIKMVDIKVQLSFSAWEYSVHTLLGVVNRHMSPLEEDNWQFHV